MTIFSPRSGFGDDLWLPRFARRAARPSRNGFLLSRLTASMSRPTSRICSGVRADSSCRQRRRRIHIPGRLLKCAIVPMAARSARGTATGWLVRTLDIGSSSPL